MITQSIVNVCPSIHRLNWIWISKLLENHQKKSKLSTLLIIINQLNKQMNQIVMGDELEKRLPLVAVVVVVRIKCYVYVCFG